MNQLRNLCLASCAAALSVTLAAPTADAVVVTITSGVDAGLVVFNSGGFENDTLSSAPAASTPAGSTWGGTSNGNTPVVTGATSGGPASSYEGTRYLKIDRSAASAILNASFSRDIDPQTESFKVEYAMWMSATDPITTNSFFPQAYFFLQPDSAGTSAPAYGAMLTGYGLRMNSSGNPELMRYRTSSGVSVTTAPIASPTWTPDQWNTVTLEWNHLTNEALLTVGNQSSVDVVFRLATGTVPVNDLPDTIGQLQLRANSSDTVFYVDSIPEPSAIALLGLGGALLLGRRRVDA